ncbi:hypothetical protein ABG82_18420 [Mycobacteroides immunogenum]|uniref:hypothetical protein n=1 Tax=Mycobacteroides immunogenum TaxID=83262 RepID=UPI00078A0002|nr:hypothetical protein [Mycobacteroides immunogenum]AMT71975.1 hypothetical protein ABG82_18420 [Mycobacteroides immunogenum]
MPSIRSDLVGVIYLPSGARLRAGDPVPLGEVVGAHLIEVGELDAIEPEPTEDTEDTEDTEAESTPVAEPRPSTSRTRKRSSGRAR